MRRCFDGLPGTQTRTRRRHIAGDFPRLGLSPVIFEKIRAERIDLRPFFETHIAMIEADRSHRVTRSGMLGHW